MRCHPRNPRHRRNHGHDHDHGHDHVHGHRRHRRGPGCGPGPIGRTFHKVMDAVAERFGLEKRWVVIGFIVCLFIHFPLAILLFLVGWFWADHPGKLERWWFQLKEPFKSAPHPASGPTADDTIYVEPETETEPKSKSGPETGDQKDPFFDDLRRQFEDLEERAQRMEQEVTSDEFELRQQFKKMKDD